MTLLASVLLAPLGPFIDPDLDAMIVEEETYVGTDAFHPDTDRDTIPDGYELYRLARNPLVPQPNCLSWPVRRLDGSAGAIDSGDLDGDGDPDLVYVDDVDGVTVVRNVGGRIGGDRVVVDPSTDIDAILVFDMGADGVQDIVAGRGDGVVAFLNDGSGAGWTTQQLVPFEVAELGAADVDGDGDLDILARTGDQIRWVELDGGSIVGTRLVGNARSTLLRNMGVGDFTGNGLPDVVVIDNVEYIIHVNRGGSFTTELFIEGAPLYHDYFDLGDVDGDGDLDLAVVGGGHVSVQVLDGVDRVGSPIRLELPADDEKVRPRLVDVDGDGDADLLTVSQAYYYSDEGFVRLYDNLSVTTGEVAFAPEVMLVSDRFVDFDLVHAFDVDADRDLDLFVGGPLYGIEIVGPEDPDRDGLSTAAETCWLGTDPDLWDTDGGGVSDRDELIALTDPSAPSDDQPLRDFDGDGLSNASESWVHGTEPRVADTDGDGVSDGDEVAAGTDPLRP